MFVASNIKSIETLISRATNFDFVSLLCLLLFLLLLSSLSRYNMPVRKQSEMSY